MAEGIAHAEEVEGVVGSGDGFGAAWGGLEIWESVGGVPQHAGAGVDAQDRAAGADDGERFACDEARATGDVADGHAVPEACAKEGLAAVPLAAAEGEPGFDAVVVLGGVVEDGPEPLAFLVGVGVVVGEEGVWRSCGRRSCGGRLGRRRSGRGGGHGKTVIG